MNKKGFTLIELLAVIVILAIIALIATPIVLNIIKDSRETAGLRSAEMYLDAAEQAISMEKMNNTNFNPSTCTIKEDGNLDCGGTNVQVEVKGEKPNSGNIKFEKGKITEVRLEYKNNKIILKNEKGNLEYFDYDRNSDINFIVEGITEQKTTEGKNLWNPYAEPDVVGTYIGWKVKDDETKLLFIRIIDKNNGVELLSNCYLGISYTGMNSDRGVRWAIQNGINATSNNIAQLEGNYISFYGVGFDEMLERYDIMVSYDYKDDYEPFTNGPSPNPDYPQEIPLAGTLNTKTGKYDIGVTASIEGGKSQTLTLTSPVKLTKWDKLVKRDGVYGWSIWSKNRQLDMSNLDYKNTHGWSVHSVSTTPEGIRTYKLQLFDKAYGFNNVLCSTFRLKENGAYDGRAEKNTCGGTSANNYVFFNTDKMTVDEWKAYIDENPLDIWYQTAEEQAFIPLPEEEQTLLYKLKL